MIRVLTCIQAQHDLRLVLLAAVICALSSALAITLYARRGAGASGLLGTLGVAGVTGGAGIWCTHFIAMLAFRPGFATGYAPVETFGSLLVSIALCALGFKLAGRKVARPWLLGGPAVGLGIGLMHYLGMAGLRTQGTLVWDPAYVVASFLLGGALATAALALTPAGARLKQRLVGAALLTVGICTLHFTGMGALTITPDPTVVVPGSSLSNVELALVAAGLMLLALGAVGWLSIVARGRRLVFRQIREAIAATPDGMAIYDAEDRLVAWNRAFVEFTGSEDGIFYGAERDEIVRAAYARIAAARGEDAALAARPDLESRIPPAETREQQSVDGRWWRIEHRPTRQGGSVSVFRDISVHKAAEARQAALIDELKITEARLLEAVSTAEDASRAKSQFLANMSHELRTPLNGVLGLSGALKRRVADPQAQEMISLIEDSGRTLERVLSDILDLSKIEARKVSIETLDFDLVHEVEVAVLPFAAKAREKGVELVLDMGGLDRLPVASDALRIRQILSNLVSNAVKFTGEGTVRVSLAVEPAEIGFRATFEVEDSGVGFDPAHVDRLFEAFEQDDTSTTRRFGGTGLGLPICRGLADLLGGQLSATSAPGVGSCFKLVVPLFPPMGAAAHPEDQEPVEVTPNLRVLLAEDHVTNQRVIELLLQPFGAELRIVENGRDAVEAVEQQTFDLVLMDMQMPVMDGLDATREIRRRELAAGRAPTPIAMLTANVSSEFVAQSLAAGADHHIAKPLTLESLVSGIEACLALAARDARAA